MTERVTLRDGTPAVVRRLGLGDHAAMREALPEGYRRLSDVSRYRRFLAPVPALTRTMLTQLIDDVDDVDHVAVALFVDRDEGQQEPVGIARMIRYPHDPSTADVAVTVLDDWQGKGAATAMLTVLSRCRPRGVDAVLTEVSAGNPAGVAMLRTLGQVRVRPAQAGLVPVEVRLSSEQAAASQLVGVGPQPPAGG